PNFLVLLARAFVERWGRATNQGHAVADAIPFLPDLVHIAGETLSYRFSRRVRDVTSRLSIITKHQMAAVAKPDFVHVGKDPLNDSLAVHVGPIQAFEVKKYGIVADPAYFGMVPGYFFGHQDDIVVLGAAKQHFFSRQGNRHGRNPRL